MAVIEEINLERSSQLLSRHRILSSMQQQLKETRQTVQSVLKNGSASFNARSALRKGPRELLI